MPDLSDEQARAADAIAAFLRNPRPAKPYFCVQGLAGTGKSHLLGHVARQHPGARICAPTGKAASVLRRRMDLPSSTIHGLLYRLIGEERDENGRPDLRFESRIDHGRWKQRIILLDESSMVSSEIARDMLNTGARVIAFGDPGQLPPVKGTQFFAEADVTLTEVHRQAWDSPIIRQAHSIRHSGYYQADGDAFRVQGFVSGEDIVAAEIMLCWKNITRRSLNDLKRAWLGLNRAPPRKGEPVMALKNDREAAVLNGAVYELLQDVDPARPIIWLTNDRGEEYELHNTSFEGVYDCTYNPDTSTPLAYAYAATCHKAQGSEWNRLILVDEYNRADERSRWLYTAVTRAAKEILVQTG